MTFSCVGAGGRTRRRQPAPRHDGLLTAGARRRLMKPPAISSAAPARTAGGVQRRDGRSATARRLARLGERHRRGMARSPWAPAGGLERGRGRRPARPARRGRERPPARLGLTSRILPFGPQQLPVGPRPRTGPETAFLPDRAWRKAPSNLPPGARAGLPSPARVVSPLPPNDRAKCRALPSRSESTRPDRLGTARQARIVRLRRVHRRDVATAPALTQRRRRSTPTSGRASSRRRRRSSGGCIIRTSCSCSTPSATTTCPTS